jgi:hypothetical protein
MKCSKLFVFAIVCTILCAGSAISFAQTSDDSPPLEIVGAEYIVGGEKPTQIEVLVVGSEGDTPINPGMVTFSSEDPLVSFRTDKKGIWTIRAESVQEEHCLVIKATINWGEEKEELEKVFTIVPKNGDNVKLTKEVIREAKERSKVAYKNLAGTIEESMKESFVATEKATAAVAFVPVRIFVAPYSTLRAYTGTTTNWLYVVAVNTSGATKIVSSFTRFTLSKSGVITFPYALYDANHGNFRAGYTVTSVTVTCKYSVFTAYAVINVIRR